jgi:hypothetical protein
MKGVKAKACMSQVTSTGKEMSKKQSPLTGTYTRRTAAIDLNPAKRTRGNGKGKRVF